MHLYTWYYDLKIYTQKETFKVDWNLKILN